MFRLMSKWTLYLVLATCVIEAAQGQENLWIFEGLITDADPELAPDLQSGWVLSGSFDFKALDLEEDIPPDADRAGRFSGGITNAELTIDLYHQLHFEAFQVSGMAGFDYKDNDPEESGRDLFGWFFPMRGELKESGWVSSWLQIWLSDPEGDMIRTVPPAISPYGIEEKKAWFRLTMVNDQKETVFVDGTIDYFGPLSGHDEATAEEDWRGVATELSKQLVERDRTIVELRDELSASIARVNSLRQMVDLMVEERNRLEEDNRLLENQAKKTDPEAEAEISGLQADKALLEDELEALTERNTSLVENLAESEHLRQQLLEKLEDAERAAERTVAQQGDFPEQQERVPVTYPGAGEVGVMTIVEHPMVVEKPVPVTREELQPESADVFVGPNKLPDTKPARPPRKFNRIGPRKFR